MTDFTQKMPGEDARGRKASNTQIFDSKAHGVIPGTKAKPLSQHERDAQLAQIARDAGKKGSVHLNSGF